MRKKGLILACGIAILSIPFTVSAQTVNIEGDPCPLTIYSSLEDGSEETAAQTAVNTLEVYGLAALDAVAVKCGDTMGYVNKADFEALLPEVDLAALPDMSGTTEITAGSNSEFTKQLQQNLVTLGYLTGTADGVYGSNTAAAISAFQTAQGLEATGTADAALQLAIADAADPKEEINTIYPMVYTVEQKFKEIYKDTDEDLEPYLDTAYTFTFDKAQDQGTITAGQVLGSYTAPEGTPDVDQISFTVEYAITVNKNTDTGKYELSPALILNSTGVFRPYVTKMILSSADEDFTLEEVTLTGSLQGVQITEQAVAPLTEEAEEAVASGKIEKIQVIGKNEEWEI